MQNKGADEITSKDFQTKVLNSKIPVLIDFYAEWCGPCQVLLPKIDQAAVKFRDKITIYKANIDKNQELTSKYHVLSVPTLIFFKNGRPVDQTSLLDDNHLADKIEELTSS